MKKVLFLIAMLMAATINYAHDIEIPLNDGWTYRPISDANWNVKRVPVTLPHTWNAKYTKKTEYNRETMVYEREMKVQKVADFIPELEVNGPESGKLLVVGWGGTYGHVLSAVQEAREAGMDVSFANFDYIMPLPRNTEEVFSRFEKILVCELNSGQFVNYLRGRLPQFSYSQYNKVQGQPFLVQEIVAAIKEQL
mgnify:CR=1 FL=1